MKDNYMQEYPSKYYEDLRRAKRKGYETAMTAWGLPEILRLRFCIRIRETDSIPHIHQIREEILRYSDAAGLIESYEAEQWKP